LNNKYSMRIQHLSAIYILFLLGTGLVLLLQGCNTSPIKKEDKKAAPPNVIILFADDLGYGDLGCYGSEKHRTPNLDALAAGGLLLTDFHVSASVCTPSRASLLTGCYAQRVSLHRDSKDHCVLVPIANKGINPGELTLAEMFKDKGYVTGCFGKWHLGDQPEFLPLNHGFDTYFGVPYSNDMDWYHPEKERFDPPLPLMRNNEVIEAPTPQEYLTKRCTDETVTFIKENKDTPFFAYFPFNMPHNPVHASENFIGKSANGIYGDAIEEIDFSVGRIMATLEDLGLDENTIIIFTSDNGAAKPFGGSNLPLAGWKGSNFEGGFRVPCIIRWKSNIPAGVTSDAFVTAMDFLPTMAEIVGYKLPKARILDGLNIAYFLKDPSKPIPDRTFCYYYRDQLQAIRKGDWKLFLPLEVKQTQWDKILREGKPQELKLVHLKNDLKETTDQSMDHPEITNKLLELAWEYQQKLGDVHKQGREQRPSGYIDFPEPRVLIEN